MIETLNQPSKFKNKILNTLHDVEIKIQAILTVSHKQQEEKEIAAMKEKPLLFYKYAAKYSITKSNICHLIDEERQSVPEPKKKAGKLRIQYESVFSQPNLEKKIQTYFIYSHVDIDKAIDKLSSWWW